MNKTTFHLDRRSAPLAVVVLLMLAACGGAATPTATPAGATNPPGQPTPAPTSTPVVTPPAGTAVDTCSLLTVAEVSAAYEQTGHEPLEGAVSSSADAYTYCEYGADGEVRIWVNNDAGQSSSIFNTAKINDGEPVSGVGDDAWWSMDSFQPGLYFMKSGRAGYITGFQYEVQDPIVQLGALMASRM
jgi:hypothetical protein